MKKSSGGIEFSDHGMDADDQAMQDLYCCPETQHLIARSYASQPRYCVRVSLRVRNPHTGVVSDFGTYLFGTVMPGDSHVAHWHSAFDHQVVAFQYRWQVGTVTRSTPVYTASAGRFFRNLGIAYGAVGDFFPIKEEAYLPVAAGASAA